MTSNRERGSLVARLAKTIVAVFGGFLLAGAVAANAWADSLAPLAWVGVALALWGLMALVDRQQPLVPIVVYVAIACLTLVWSLAVGSSWAAATWWPLVFVAIALGRASTAFLLAATVTILVQDATTVVVLGAQGASGSVQYLVGFVGVLAAPLWFRLATTYGVGVVASLSRVGGVVVSALAVWAVLASGSRAALLGFFLACLTVGIAQWVRRSASRTEWRRVGGAALAVALVVPTIDLGLGFAMGTGGSVVSTTLAQRLDTSLDQVRGEGSPVGGIRVPLWRQAIVALFERPLGHGPASYGHVIHAYQGEPMLWSGSPHSLWALVAVESGALGLLGLAVVTLGGLVAAMRRSMAVVAALVGATVVMSLDVFASMPVPSLLWWGVIGAAWGPSGVVRGRAAPIVVALALGLVAIGVGLSWRLALPCAAPCDPIIRFGGHPQMVGLPRTVIGDDPDDPRWLAWRQRYPTAFWLAYAENSARAVGDPSVVIDLLRAYPFQSAQTYVDAALVADDGRRSSDIAACGLSRFFDGRAIRNDWRAQGPVLDEQRRSLEQLAGEVVADESACERAAIPGASIGLQRP